MIKNKSKIGQGLLETIFAIGILLIVVSAVMALATSSITGQQESEAQILGNNLAREGIEVIRNIRDSNILAGKKWDDGLHSGTALVRFESFDNSWSLDYNYQPGDNKIYFYQDGVYAHDNGQINKSTPYARTVTISHICLRLQNPDQGHEDIKDNCDPDSEKEKKIGLKVSSQIFWTDKSRLRKIIIEDLLYAWK